MPADCPSPSAREPRRGRRRRAKRVSANRQRDYPIRRVLDGQRRASARAVLVRQADSDRVADLRSGFGERIVVDCRDTVRVNRSCCEGSPARRARSGSVREEYLPFLRSPNDGPRRTSFQSSSAKYQCPVSRTADRRRRYRFSESGQDRGPLWSGWQRFRFSP